ncbi:MAG: hypothetical protein OEM82_14245 [Acidobacteriota bacterium]|nr:hypothetical protein [Acidobacteriota bacterium]MDH3531055.1 hypothetical protein [Acidobacteriota bacterium]
MSIFPSNTSDRFRTEKIPFSGKEAEWFESEESYSLSESDGVTELTVEFDADEEFKGFMTEKFPIALAMVKQLCEKGR